MKFWLLMAIGWTISCRSRSASELSDLTEAQRIQRDAIHLATLDAELRLSQGIEPIVSGILRESYAVMRETSSYTTRFQAASISVRAAIHLRDVSAVSGGFDLDGTKTYEQLLEDIFFQSGLVLRREELRKEWNSQLVCFDYDSCIRALVAYQQIYTSMIEVLGKTHPRLIEVKAHIKADIERGVGPKLLQNLLKMKLDYSDLVDDWSVTLPPTQSFVLDNSDVDRLAKKIEATIEDHARAFHIDSFGSLSLNPDWSEELFQYLSNDSWVESEEMSDVLEHQVETIRDHFTQLLSFRLSLERAKQRDPRPYLKCLSEGIAQYARMVNPNQVMVRASQGCAGWAFHPEIAWTSLSYMILERREITQAFATDYVAAARAIGTQLSRLGPDQAGRVKTRLDGLEQARQALGEEIRVSLKSLGFGDVQSLLAKERQLAIDFPGFESLVHQLHAPGLGIMTRHHRGQRLGFKARLIAAKGQLKNLDQSDEQLYWQQYVTDFGGLADWSRTVESMAKLSVEIPELSKQSTREILASTLKLSCLAHLSSRQPAPIVAPEKVGIFNTCFSSVVLPFITSDSGRNLLDEQGRPRVDRYCRLNKGEDFNKIELGIDQALRALEISDSCKSLTDELVMTGVSIVSAPIAAQLTGQVMRFLVSGSSKLVSSLSTRGAGQAVQAELAAAGRTKLLHAAWSMIGRFAAKTGKSIGRMLVESSIFTIINRGIYLPLGQPIIDETKSFHENSIDFARDMLLGAAVFGVIPHLHKVLNHSTAEILTHFPKSRTASVMGFVLPKAGEAAFFRYLADIENSLAGDLIPDSHREHAAHPDEEWWNGYKAWGHAIGMTLAFNVGRVHRPGGERASKIEGHNQAIANLVAYKRLRNETGFRNSKFEQDPSKARYFWQRLLTGAKQTDSRILGEKEIDALLMKPTELKSVVAMGEALATRLEQQAKNARTAMQSPEHSFVYEGADVIKWEVEAKWKRNFLAWIRQNPAEAFRMSELAGIQIVIERLRKNANAFADTKIAEELNGLSQLAIDAEQWDSASPLRP